ncbi:MAG TPA: hypothetical protein VKQ29_01460 [Aliidongia sp.]|nr:hypothetical protein [Aliidongia sp.]
MTAKHQSGVTELLEHRWPTTDWPVARLTVPLEQIAARNGLTVQSWIEDGLGPATGCGGRLTSGVVIQLVELAYLISQGGARGPDLYADASDAHNLGIENLIAEALSALSLSWADVEWRNQAPTAEEIATFKRYVDQRRRNPVAELTLKG